MTRISVGAPPELCGIRVGGTGSEKAELREVFESCRAEGVDPPGSRQSDFPATGSFSALALRTATVRQVTVTFDTMTLCKRYTGA